MDDSKQNDICGETKEFGEQRFVCARKPHATVIRQRRWDNRDGVHFTDEPAAESHRFVNPNRL